MKKIFIPIIIILLVVIVGGYYWWQKNQTIIPKAGQVSCDTLKDIPSVDYAPENVRQRFLECFPDRVGGVKPPVSAPSGVSPAPAKEISPSLEEVNSSNCAQFSAIPSAQYCSMVPDPNGRTLCEQCKAKGY